MNLFTYGTLMFPDVMEAVAGFVPESSAATAIGYARYRVREQVYPGLVLRAGARTNGRLYLGLKVDVIQVLDRFEGDVFERASVAVETGPGFSISCEVYLVSDPCSGCLSEEPWDPDRFLSEHGEAYLAMCRTFRTQIRRIGDRG